MTRQISDNLVLTGALNVAGAVDFVSNLNVDAAFTTNAAANRFATITAALAACTGGETIRIAPGIYTEDFTIADDGIKLIGSGQPYYDSGTGRLVNGTIIRGRISTGVVAGLVIRDLGVDLVGVDNKDCIGGTNTDAALARRYENLTLLGNGSGALSHGLYVVGHGTTIHNVQIYRCYHGMAIHGAHTNASDMHVEQCYGTAIVIKSKNGYDVYDVNLNNITMLGDTVASTSRSGPLQLQTADSTSLYNINISNVTAHNCINGIFQILLGDATGDIANVSLVNCTSYNNSDAALVGDFRIKDVDGLYLTACRSFSRLTGYGFEIEAGGTATNIYVYGAFADATGAGTHSGAFDFIEMNGNPGVIANSLVDFLTLTQTVATIASGVITPLSSFVVVDTEAAAATDDLTTINGGVAGKIMILTSDSSSRDVVIKNGTGNIDCGADITLTGNRDTIMFIYKSGVGKWERLSFGDNI